MTAEEGPQPNGLSGDQSALNIPTDDTRQRLGRRLGQWGIALGIAALLLLPLAAFTTRWVVMPGFFLALAALILGVLGISRTSGGLAHLSKRATIPEAAFALGVFFFAGAAGLAYLIGPVNSKACEPFESCDAVVELVFSEAITGSELQGLCTEWNSLGQRGQELLVKQWQKDAKTLIGGESAALFNSPRAAVEGMVPAAERVLNARC